MLLANMSVAKKIEKEFPKLAILRCHPEPEKNMMIQLLEKLGKQDIILDDSSSKALAESLEKYKGTDDSSKTKYSVRNALTVSMQYSGFFR